MPHTYLYAAGVAALALATAGQAQTPQDTVSADAASAPPSGASNEAQGEILVTARRRAESALTVPLAITALDQGELDRKRITQTQDLVNSVPSLQVQPATNQRQSGAVTIRGQGQAYAGVQPSVISYFAEVPLDPNGGAAFSAFDLENVQVLRGPQGTLFGRNTTGGAVLYVPKAPGDQFEANASASTGNYGLADLRLAVSIPLTDTLSVRIAGQSVNRRGFTANLATGNALDDQHYQVARLFARWEPTPGIRNDFIVSALRADENGSGFILSALFPGTSADTFMGGALRQALVDQIARGPRAVSSNELLGARRRMLFLANTTAIDLNETVKLRNIFSYQHVQVCFGTDLDGSPVPYTVATCLPNRYSQALGRPIHDIVDQNQFTDEVQFVGTLLHDRLDFVAGAFFFDTRTPGGLDTFRFNRIGKTSNSVNAESAQVRDSSRALYAQSTYKFSDQLKATAGFRYTWDKRAISNGSYGSTDGGTTFTCRAVSVPGQTHRPSDPIDSCFTQFRGKYSDYGYTASLDWQLSPRSLIYATTRRGYKSGGFNTVTALTLSSFGPENATDYEVGVKSRWRKGAVSGRFNGAAFIGRYKHLQRNYTILVNSTVSTVIQSSADATIKGVEIDGGITFFDHFELSGFYSHLNASYKNGTYTQPSSGQDISGSRFPALADDSGSATARVFTKRADNTELSLSGTLYKTSSVAFSSDTVNNPTAIAPGYTIFSAAAEWRGIHDGRLDVTLWAKNLTDKAYVVGGLGLQSVLGYNSLIYGEPRTYGVTLAAHL